eukprot:GEZU01007865.1.p1 GENE.GEZU01007865.1~~GEZU01007865.1.p1  ORF type:complete len:144 (+),score=54.87 GEZU01007865.1:156-587(+)
MAQADAEEIREAFNLFDRGDGNISTKDLVDAMRCLGLNPSADQINEITSRFPNGAIDVNSFTNVIQSAQKKGKITEEELRMSFLVFDATQSGRIERKELQHIMLTMGESLTQEEFEGMLNEIGQTGNMVEYGDICRLLASGQQ